MDLEHLEEMAKIKGLNLIGTGDFTHPQWFQELQDKLVEADGGFYKLKNSNSNIRFVLSSEISSIYSKNGKTHRIHNVILMPDLKSAQEFNRRLSFHGNLASDGRPIVGVDAHDLLALALEVNNQALFIPAHIWTPWFSLFGSMSGFDSLEECFEDLAPFIKVCETGLSSDPLMNWRLSQLDQVTLVSNSDSHSLEKLGREANVFNIDFNYNDFYNALITKNPEKFLYTIEFYPEEGKYHYDGHRLCKVNLSPAEAKKLNNICPVCHKNLTIGVLHRVDDLADRAEEEAKNFGIIPFKCLMSLKEIIADLFSTTTFSKKTQDLYSQMIRQYDNEFNILLNISLQQFIDDGFGAIGAAIEKVRRGEVDKIPGYDGEYGIIRIKKEEPSNIKLFEI